MRVGSRSSALLLVVVVFAAAPTTVGAQQSPTRADGNELSTDYVEPWTVAARSLVLPGWGQFHLDQDIAGQAYLAAALVGAALGLEVVELVSRENSRAAVRSMGWVLYGFSAVMSSTSAWTAAEARNRENGWLIETRLGLDDRPLLAITRRF